MSSPWARLTELPGLMAVRAAWGNFPEELLRPASESAPVLPCEKGHACQRVVIEHGPGDAVGICMQTPPHCDARPVKKDERAVYRLDEKTLFSRIHQLLGMTGTPEQLPGEAWHWRLGSVPAAGDRSLPVFFVLARNATAVDAALGRLAMTHRECFLLIVSDGKILREPHRTTARACRSIIVPLDDLFAIDVDGRISSRATGPESGEEIASIAIEQDLAGVLLVLLQVLFEVGRRVLSNDAVGDDEYTKRRIVVGYSLTSKSHGLLGGGDGLIANAQT